MNLTPAKQKIVDAAVAAGYDRIDHETCIDLVKHSKHRQPIIIRGIRWFADGTAICLGIDLAIASGMRSHADIRAVLGLPN